MKNKINIIFLVLFLILLNGCSFLKNDEQKETPETLVMNENESLTSFHNFVFDENLMNEIIEIDYWNGDSKIRISDKQSILDIYSLFASLDLTVCNENIDIEGFLRVDFITAEKTINVTFTSHFVNVDGQYYKTSNDITDKVLNLIAVTNE